MSLVEHAETELKIAGLFDGDSDYEGMLGESVLELVKVFAGQGHSGYSAMMTVDLLSRLLKYEPLGPLTDNPSEWNHIDERMGGPNLWQSRRNPQALSHDGGKTYYLLSEWSDKDEKPVIWHESENVD